MTPDFTIALSKLLSSLYTDAEMALADEWDRADAGFETQINLIEAFATRFHIPLYDTTEEAKTDDAVEDLMTQPSLQTVSSASETAPDHADLSTLHQAWHDRFNWLWNQLNQSWNETELAQVHELADGFDQVVSIAAQTVSSNDHPIKREGVTAQQLLHTLQELDIYLANEADGIVVTEAEAMPLVCGDIIKIVFSKLSVWSEAEQALLDPLIRPSTSDHYVQHYVPKSPAN